MGGQEAWSKLFKFLIGGERSGMGILGEKGGPRSRYVSGEKDEGRVAGIEKKMGLEGNCDH